MGYYQSVIIDFDAVLMRKLQANLSDVGLFLIQPVGKTQEIKSALIADLEKAPSCIKERRIWESSRPSARIHPIPIMGFDHGQTWQAPKIQLYDAPNLVLENDKQVGFTIQKKLKKSVLRRTLWKMADLDQKVNRR